MNENPTAAISAAPTVLPSINKLLSAEAVFNEILTKEI